MATYKKVTLQELTDKQITVVCCDNDYYLVRNTWGRGESVTCSYELVIKDGKAWRNAIKYNHDANTFEGKNERFTKEKLLSALWEKSEDKQHDMPKWNPHITAKPY